MNAPTRMEDLGLTPDRMRAYSVFEVKSYDLDERTIEGIATTPTPDRMDDVVESLGAQFKLPIPLLWQHRSGEPVGHVEFAEVTEKGIPFRARLAKIEEPGELKNLVDKAWQAVKAKLVRGVSIGFRALEVEPIFKGKNDFVGFRFKSWEWLELSLVTIPANSEASISTIRSLDSAVRAASGKAPSGQTPPGVSGHPKQTVKSQEPKMAKTIAEQISAFEATRQAKDARRNEIMEKASEENVTLDDDQQEEYDGLDADIKKIDAHLVRLRRLEESNRASAKPANGGSQQDGSESRGNGSAKGNGVSSSVVVSTRRNLPEAIGFARYAIAIGKSRGNLLQAVEIAKHWSDTTPEVEMVLRAAVAAGTTTDPAWAAPLVVYQQLAGEFIEFLRTRTMLGRIPRLRRVPFNVQIPAQTSGSLAQWVGELQSKPVSALAFTSVTLRWAKVANIMVLSDELVRFSNPAAEALVRDDLANGLAQFLDQQFTLSTVTEVVNVSPASITNGAPSSGASGVTADDLRADIKTVLASFDGANIPTNGLVILMRNNQATSLSMMLNPLGLPEFANVTDDGGSLFGYTIITSNNVPAGDIIFLKPEEILIADDGQVTIDASREASLQLDSAPSEPPTSMVSLFQQNAMAIRAERFITWKRRRTQAVYRLTGTDYGGVAT